MFESMFKSQVRITGKHAIIMQKLCKDKSSDQDVQFMVSDSPEPIYIFDTRINCYMVAAMLGIINHRTAEPDHDKLYRDANSNIFQEALDNNRSNLKRIYEHMVFAEDDGLSPDDKVKKAFSSSGDGDWKTEQDKFEDYVRGGLEILDETFSRCNSYEEIADAIIDLAKSLRIDD